MEEIRAQQKKNRRKILLAVATIMSTVVALLITSYMVREPVMEAASSIREGIAYYQETK